VNKKRECDFPLDPLVEVMDRLLAPGGCPWDREQTHESLRPYVVEEAYEVVGAIDSGDPAKLEDELGDLLLQVVFHAALARREARFDVNDVIGTITAKLLRRHPHVFGESQAGTPEAVLRQWEDIKRQEAGAGGREAGAGGQGAGAGGQGATTPRLEAHLPALMQAQKLLERTARLGRPVAEGASMADSETAEADFGEMLLAVLERGRRAGVDAELALRAACGRLALKLERGGE